MAIQTPLGEMTVEELLSRWPQMAQVFHRYKMACVGCPVASFYTVDEAIKVYGLAREQVLTELEQLTKESESHKERRPPP